MKRSDLNENEYKGYFSLYINQVPDLPLMNALDYSQQKLLALLVPLSEAQLLHRYEPNKWTIKEIIVHLIDTERIFNYRALRYARQDKTPLPGYEQDDYVATCNANEQSIADLIALYKAQRISTKLFYKSMSEEMMLSMGTASGNSLSVRAIAFMQAGHELHHIKVMEERYL